MSKNLLLLRIYFVPELVRYIDFYLVFKLSIHSRVFIIPMLQMKKLRHKESQGHVANVSSKGNN